MKIDVKNKLIGKSTLTILGLYEGDKSSNNDLKEAVKKKRFSGKFGETFESGNNAFIGLGKKKELTLDKVRKIFGKSVMVAKISMSNNFETNLPPLLASSGLFEDKVLGMAVAEGLILGNYDFVKYLSKDRMEKKIFVETVDLEWKSKSNSFEEGIKIGSVIAESTNFVKDLVNESAGVATSVFIENVAKKVTASNSKIKMKVLDKSELEKLGMGALLGVNAGSKNPPKLVILEYNGGKGKPIAFVGKGITFDSGGYNLKPTKYIEDMKTDMGGAAASLGALKVAAELGIEKNVMAVMALCENMVSSTAQHPGDIVKSYSGKTIEIGNTDAEGRLVLADALAYTQAKYNPEVIIDLATLTGACVVALGYYAAALVGKDQGLMDDLRKAGMESGDKVWQMPFYDEYQDWMDGSISDLNNISQKGKGYEAGSITAGVFLSKFVDTEKTKWAHLDIAGSAYWTVTGEYTQKGATGSGVRVLTYYLLNS